MPAQTQYGKVDDRVDPAGLQRIEPRDGIVDGLVAEEIRPVVEGIFHIHEENVLMDENPAQVA